MTPFLLRLAQVEDLAAVLALPPLLGPADELVADAWPTWLSDPGTSVSVATIDEVVVGALHCLLVAPDEGWIEALRVAPALRERGLATALVRGGITWAQGQNAATVRASAPASDATMGGILAGNGFAQVGSFVRFAAPVAGATPDSFAAPRIRQPAPDELDRLWDWLVHSNLSPLTGGLYLEGDRAAALTDLALEGFLAAQQVWTLEDHGAVRSLVIAGPRQSDSHETRFTLRYLDGATQGISQLALHLRALAATEGDRYSLVDARPPDLRILQDALNGAGFARVDDDVQWVYAKMLG